MPDTYSYDIYCQVKLNGVWLTANGASIKATQDMGCRWVVRVYHNTDRMTANNVRVAAVRSSNVCNWKNLDPVVTELDSGGNVVWFAEAVPVQSSGSFKANITVERYTGSSWVAIPIKAGEKATTINYTSAGVIPPFPTTKPDGSGQVTDLYTAVGGNFKTGNLKWDATSVPGGEWILAVETPVSGNPKAFTISYTSFSSDGKKKTTTPLGNQNGKSGTLWTAAQNRLLQAVQDTGTTDTTGTVNPAIPDPKKSAFSYNPPNHIWTRRPSLDELMAGRDNNFYVTDAPTAAQALATNNAAYTSVTKTHPLGSMMQDTATAANLNKKIGVGKTQVYGFNFTYNPTSISYTTSANTPIDWTLNSGQPANILGGPTIVTFDLYLNRIQDLNTLKKGYKATAYPAGGISDTDQKGLLYRGTEYDLEWLYRVVNGSPATTTSLLEYGGETADFGYITGTPFWLKFHNNMKYYGGLAALSVNHVMFTKDMIPILTIVSVTFNRYPVFDTSGYVGGAQKKTTDANVNNQTPTVPG